MNNDSTVRSTGVMVYIKGIPILMFLFFLALIIVYPEFFPWITHKDIFLGAIVSMVVFQIVMFVLSEIFKKQALWMRVVGYVFIIAEVFIIYSTGGMDSPFVLVLISVPLVSISYLDLKLTRNIGIVSILGMASLIFLDKKYLENPAYITKEVFFLTIFTVFIFWIYGIIKDVVRQKVEKEQLQKKFVQINEIDKIKKVFLTAISHQLRTPLTGARWAITDALKNQSMRNKELLSQGLERIIQSINIVGEMLKSTEYDLDEEKIKLNVGDFVLSNLIKKIIHNLDFLIQSKGVSLSYGEMDSSEINGDENMIGIAFTNIFDNAFRYSPNGKVSISVKKEKQFIRVIVKDTGIGIDSSDMEYVSQKFFRGKNALLTDPNESGIGLYATKKIIELHKGEIKISSVLNKGTTVDVILPLATNKV